MTKNPNRPRSRRQDTSEAEDAKQYQEVAGPPRDQVWQGCCKLALNLRHSNKVAEFEQALQAGALPVITEPAMMTAALHLTGGMATAGVRKWNWLPAPSGADLADPVAWVTQRLASRRAEQDEADSVRRLNQKAARALGQSPPSGNGTIAPVHEQQSTLSLDELAERLERLMGRPGFEREWLDHRSPHYVPVSAGGVSNKQIAIAVSEITGSRTRRSFDANWKIVTDWLRDRRANAKQPEPDRAA